MKILVCCGSGLGSSFMIEMNIQNVLKSLGISGVVVDHSDLSSANGIKADIYVGTRDIAVRLVGLGGEVVSLNNMIDKKELESKLVEVLKKLNYIK
ncbi:PTS sugar transporter subunit IIB [Clostridium sp.]|uniref:PTS sugar transporter subunit IIB n=1 Tax=Clostridium sp. TaxID=1506 RepID=UPI002612C9EC|nr:PTS sugar transporter subunit IIB [Clostridium sp.]